MAAIQAGAGDQAAGLGQRASCPIMNFSEIRTTQRGQGVALALNTAIVGTREVIRAPLARLTRKAGTTGGHAPRLPARVFRAPQGAAASEWINRCG